MLSEAEVRSLLQPFGLALTSRQIGQMLRYLELLFRWNRKINLTAIRSPDQAVIRHFGESLYLARWLELRDRLLDIGSGAGFPGLALKIPFPELSVTLLEPIAKKRAFLKEVARVCEMSAVGVRPERLEDFKSPERFDSATARAVGGLDELVIEASRRLRPGGHLCLWLTRDQAPVAAKAAQLIEWRTPVAVPLSSQREIWIGTRIDMLEDNANGSVGRWRP